MFSFAKTHQDTWDSEFDVYYYDQLANQDDVYRITLGVQFSLTTTCLKL